MNGGGATLAKFEFTGVDEYLKKVRKLVDPAEYRQYVGQAVYVGAGLVADNLKGAIQSIPTRSPKDFGTPEKPVNGILAIQKKGLYDSFGIAPMEDRDGFISVKIGFDGYNGLKTKTYPNGQPNAMVARSVESGSSWQKKTPFISKVVRSSKDAAEREMAQELDKQIEKLMQD